MLFHHLLINFQKIISGIPSVSDRLDPDQAEHFVYVDAWLPGQQILRYVGTIFPVFLGKNQY